MPPRSFATSRRFLPLFLTQFLGAFNDNLFKTALFVLIAYGGLAAGPSLGPSQLLNLGAALFVLPFFLFSSIAGDLSTKFDKARLARWVKAPEILVMALGAWGFFGRSLPVLFLALFLMGSQSALFGPLKYAIVPEYLKRGELLFGNALIEGATFASILLGQIFGAALAASDPEAIGPIAVGVAALGFACSLAMPRVGAVAPQARIDLNIARSTRAIARGSLARPGLKAPILGASWFWFLGALYTAQLPVFVKDHLLGDQNVFNLILALFSIGIGAGSVWCAHASQGRLNLKFAFAGLAGMCVFGLLMALPALPKRQGELMGIAAFLQSGAAAWLASAGALGLGVCGGAYSTPLYTWMQLASGNAFRAKAVAFNNIANAVFMIGAAAFGAVALSFADNVAGLYLLAALANAAILAALAKEKSKLALLAQKTTGSNKEAGEGGKSGDGAPPQAQEADRKHSQ